MESLLGRGIYSIRDVSLLTHLRPSRVREWFRGSPRSQSAPIFRSDFCDESAVSFLDLVDVFIAGQLREHGVSLQAIRKTYNHLKNQLGVAHPFCREEILTDGKHIFLGGLTKRGQEQIRNAIDGQYVFPQIIRPFLKSLTYDSSSRIACKWQINKIVTIDPGHCFGQPIIDKAGIPTTILATAYAGNSQNAKLVARWYGVKQSHVMAAVEFESKNAA